MNSEATAARPRSRKATSGSKKQRAVAHNPTIDCSAFAVLDGAHLRVPSPGLTTCVG